MSDAHDQNAHAEGVTYFTIAGADLRMFRCEPQAATLSTRGCAGRWSAAQARKGVADGNPCSRCPIGAAHAGQRPVTYSRDFASDRCPRCDQGTTRMINDRVCVSCYNREREVRAGANGRGNRPRELAGLGHIPVRIAVDGVIRRPELRTAAVRHIAQVKIGRHKGRHGKPGKPIYEPVQRGGVAEAAAQSLRITKGCIDLLPIALVPLTAALKGRLPL